MEKHKSYHYRLSINDEWYTSDYGVTAIVPYVLSKYLLDFKHKGKMIVWCPFDTEDSEFVKQLSKLRPGEIEVIHSHIWEGQDFFEYEQKEWDIIVSNPPFKDKKKFFQRALELGKPFALLMTATWLNDRAPIQIFMEAKKQLQLLLLDKRMEFNRPHAGEHKSSNPTFASHYYCYNFLPNDLVLAELEKPKKQRKQKRKEMLNEQTN